MPCGAVLAVGKRNAAASMPRSPAVAAQQWSSWQPQTAFQQQQQKCLSGHGGACVPPSRGALHSFCCAARPLAACPPCWKPLKTRAPASAVPAPRSETYQYFNLPFCHPKEGKEYKPEGLGEVLEGDRLVSTPYKLQ